MHVLLLLSMVTSLRVTTCYERITQTTRDSAYGGTAETTSDVTPRTSDVTVERTPSVMLDSNINLTRFKTEAFQKYTRNSTDVSQALSTKGVCNIKIVQDSTNVFQHVLSSHSPTFVQFRIYLTQAINSTSDAFQPSRWYWTFKTDAGTYPFLSWNLDYGLVSFGLLDYRTAHVKYVNLNVTGDCNLKFGTKRTLRLIARALIPAINVTRNPGFALPIYTKNFFCYLATRKDLHNTVQYYASLYIYYPISFIQYKCCFLEYNYTTKKFSDECSHDTAVTNIWVKMMAINMFIRLIIAVYWPITIFQLYAYLEENDKIQSHDTVLELSEDADRGEEYQTQDEEDDWIYSNGKSPLTLLDIFSLKTLGLDIHFPVLVSRVRRCVWLILAPFVIYIQILWYSRGMGVWDDDDKITVRDLVNVGTPMGFLAILGDSENRHKSFAPLLGGPVGVAVMYFTFGFCYSVLPRCLKEIIEAGLPKSNSIVANNPLTFRGRPIVLRPSQSHMLNSPLFFGDKDIVKISKLSVQPEHLDPGYTKGATLMKCNFYMLFTKTFWYQVWIIQTNRVAGLVQQRSVCLCMLGVFCIPLYMAFCLLEILCCLIYFGCPLCFFLLVVIRGAIEMLDYTKQRNSCLSYMLSFRAVFGFGIAVLFVTLSLFTYSLSLILTQSVAFVVHAITKCFVAVIMYPSVGFGKLFFFVVLLYYLMRQISNFGNEYTRLLKDAVTIAKRISKTENHVTCFNGHLLVSNVGIETIRDIKINGRLLHADHRVRPMSESFVKVRMKNNSYGIPKDLFENLVQKFRPVHKQVLSLFFRVSIFIIFVVLFLSITANHIEILESEMSEVMHVVFIIAMGALPKLIDSKLVNTKILTLVKRIEHCRIEKLIVEYWTNKGNED